MADIPQKLSRFCGGHKKKLVCELNNFLYNKELIDVTLVCVGGKIRAHQAVLSAFSPILKDIFCNNSSPHPIVVFLTVPKYIMSALVNFMYSGKLVIAPELLPSVLQIAKELEIEGFKKENHKHSDGVNKNVEKNKPVENHQVVLNPFAINANGALSLEIFIPPSDDSDNESDEEISDNISPVLVTE